jgi:hypothetical protein
MGTPDSWIICEKSGRWAVALRIALERRKCELPGPRILETRSLAELDIAIKEHEATFVLVEVRPESTADILSYLAKNGSRRARLVAMLEFAGERSADCRLVADALLEGGAVEVIESPRQLSAVLGIAERRPRQAWGEQAETIADRAWAALPWQDA